MSLETSFPREEFPLVNAGIAQLVEQLICNQQVIGSSPIAGLTFRKGRNRCDQPASPRSASRRPDVRATRLAIDDRSTASEARISTPSRALVNPV